MIEAWNEFWFADGSFLNLAISRILILSYFLFIKMNDRAFRLEQWQAAREHFQDYWRKPGILHYLGIPYLSRGTEVTLIWVWRLAIFSAIIGLLTPVACLIAFVLGLYLLGLRHGLKLHHTIVPINFILIALALGPSGQMYSVDHYLGIQYFPEEHLAAMANWSLQFIKVTMVLIVFATGVAKFRRVSLTEGFLKKGNLSTLLRLHEFGYFWVHPIIPMGKWMRRFPILEASGALGTLIVELFFPLALFYPITQFFFVPSFVFLIFSFRVFQGPRFDFFNCILIVSFMPWDWFIK
ncbi:MAG: hypothetical protein HRT45_01065 [Bdellovibrionales bacterium]|nr:hypothetical protein [Bdellovibrionales bacterium]